TSLTIAIPTYCREQVLLETIHHLLSLQSPNTEILVLDQSPSHIPQVESELLRLHAIGKIRLLRLDEPSIPKAMNYGLVKAKHDLVLFVDDDIIPEANLIQAHLSAQGNGKGRIIAGRVIQPWQEGLKFSQDKSFNFASLQSAKIENFMAG